jgi:hypothetical protein
LPQAAAIGQELCAFAPLRLIGLRPGTTPVKTGKIGKTESFPGLTRQILQGALGKSRPDSSAASYLPASHRLSKIFIFQ